jgi:hypothetical protein
MHSSHCAIEADIVKLLIFLIETRLPSLFLLLWLNSIHLLRFYEYIFNLTGYARSWKFFTLVFVQSDFGFGGGGDKSKNAPSIDIAGPAKNNTDSAVVSSNFGDVNDVSKRASISLC